MTIQQVLCAPQAPGHGPHPAHDRYDWRQCLDSCNHLQRSGAVRTGEIIRGLLSRVQNTSPAPRTRRRRGRFSQQNSDASSSRKSPVSIAVRNGAQPETVRGDGGPGGVIADAAYPVKPIATLAHREYCVPWLRANPYLFAVARRRPAGSLQQGTTKRGACFRRRRVHSNSSSARGGWLGEERSQLSFVTKTRAS